MSINQKNGAKRDEKKRPTKKKPKENQQKQKRGGAFRGMTYFEKKRSAQTEKTAEAWLSKKLEQKMGKVKWGLTDNPSWADT